MVETVPGPTVPPLVIIFHILNDATLTLATRTKEMTISIAFSLKIHKSARFPLQMIHPDYKSTCNSVLPSIHQMLLSAMSAAKDVVPLHTRVRDTSLHLETPAVVFQEYPAVSSSESFLHEEDSRARGGCHWQGLALLQHPGPPASSLVGAPGGQQQLRFGSDGCLRSLKPLPPDGRLASVDGILRLISIKSSFMFIAFFALVSTKMA